MSDEIPEAMCQQIFKLMMPGYPVQLVVNAIIYDDKTVETTARLMSMVGPDLAVVPIEAVSAAAVDAGAFEYEDGENTIVAYQDLYFVGFSPSQMFFAEGVDASFVQFDDDGYSDFYMDLGSASDIKAGSYYKIADMSVSGVGSTYDDDGLVLDIPTAEIHTPEGKVIAIRKMGTYDDIPIEFVEMGVPAGDILEGAALMNADRRVLGIHIKNSEHSGIDGNENAMFLSCRTIAKFAQFHDLDLNGDSYDGYIPKKKGGFFSRFL